METFCGLGPHIMFHYVFYCINLHSISRLIIDTEGTWFSFEEITPTHLFTHQLKGWSDFWLKKGGDIGEVKRGDCF